MATIETDDLISISDASKLGVSGLVREAEEGQDRIVLRNNKPVAAVVSIDRYERLQQLEEDLIDLTLAASRMMTTGPVRYSLDEILEQFGYTRDELADLPD